MCYINTSTTEEDEEEDKPHRLWLSLYHPRFL